MSSEYCCLHRHPAPCATFGSPHTAARSRVCHGSPVRPPIAADFIARLCHVPLSGLLTLLVGSIFVIGCC
ncbi:unnamed protein product, partial [Staurois parvus]